MSVHVLYYIELGYAKRCLRHSFSVASMRLNLRHVPDRERVKLLNAILVVSHFDIHNILVW